MKNATIFDVAKLAGVSRGTVDRVVYGRGRVSQETVDKVHKAIKELNYSVNVNAASLASRQVHTFAYLIPRYKSGEYWEEIDKGFKQAHEHITFCNLNLVPFYYDQTDVESYRKQAEAIIKLAPRGVITNAVFNLAVHEFAERLAEKNIKFAFIDNKYDDIDYLLYYGINPYKSGELGAFLLTNRQKVSNIALIRIKRDARKNADPNAPRRHGLIDYITNHIPGCAIHTVYISSEDDAETGQAMENFVNAHPEVKHFIITCSRLYLLHDWLKAHPDPERMVVGYDSLESNLSVLREGHADFLIIHNISDQPEMLVKEFVTHVVRGLTPETKNNYLSLDIVTGLNV